MKEIRRSAIVEHSAAQMYALVDDIASYPRFLPWCTAVEIRQVDGKKRATLTAAMRGIKQSFTTLNETRPAEAMDMHLVDGPFRHFEASWRFRPLGEHACQIEFALRYEFASRALGTLLGPLFNSIADTMVDAFTRRAAELYGPD
jgi:ribosome-associated toxin RatA of RatAB toxin-antitoxin module